MPNAANWDDGIAFIIDESVDDVNNAVITDALFEAAIYQKIKYIIY